MSSNVPHLDRGIEGWYRAIEVRSEQRTGSVVRLAFGRYRVVGPARRLRPEREGGVVVLVAPI